VAVEADDTVLVRRAQGGDRAAFGELVHRYQGAVYGFVRHLVQSPDLAADITQEVFVRAWRYLGRFDTSRPFRPWLYRIAVNRTASMRKREDERATVELDELTHEPAAPDDVAGELERGELADAVHLAIAELSAQQRQAIVLVELQGHTANEAAVVMACSAATVRQHVFRGKKRLRKLLEAYLAGREPAAEES
jgi:RNA polymerase sigma-70 factor (ECF subfamily)